MVPVAGSSVKAIQRARYSCPSVKVRNIQFCQLMFSAFFSPFIQSNNLSGMLSVLTYVNTVGVVPIAREQVRVEL
jgi:hypothetical protein